MALARHAYDLSPHSHAPKMTVRIRTGKVLHEVVMDRHPRRNLTYHIQRATTQLKQDGYLPSSMQLVDVVEG